MVKIEEENRHVFWKMSFNGELQWYLQEKYNW